MPKGSTGISMGGSIEYTRSKFKHSTFRPEIEAHRKPRGACLNCAYYYRANCTFDGTENPEKASCENYISARPKAKAKKGAGSRKSQTTKKR